MTTGGCIYARAIFLYSYNSYNDEGKEKDDKNCEISTIYPQVIHNLSTGYPQR